MAVDEDYAGEDLQFPEHPMFRPLLLLLAGLERHLPGLALVELARQPEDIEFFIDLQANLITAVRRCQQLLQLPMGANPCS